MGWLLFSPPDLLTTLLRPPLGARRLICMEDFTGSFAFWFPIRFVHRGVPVGDWKEGRDVGFFGLAVSLDQRTQIPSGDRLYMAPGSGSHTFSGPSGPRDSIGESLFSAAYPVLSLVVFPYSSHVSINTPFIKYFSSCSV